MRRCDALRTPGRRRASRRGVRNRAVALLRADRGGAFLVETRSASLRLSSRCLPLRPAVVRVRVVGVVRRRPSSSASSARRVFLPRHGANRFPPRPHPRWGPHGAQPARSASRDHAAALDGPPQSLPRAARCSVAAVRREGWARARTQEDDSSRARVRPRCPLNGRTPSPAHRTQLPTWPTMTSSWRGRRRRQVRQARAAPGGRAPRSSLRPRARH